MKRVLSRVPEVLQSSLTDCGPAALKAVLEGFGLDVEYNWLRNRCETDVDGTSIDALASLARELGLKADQVLVPIEHVLLPAARCLPAIMVTRTGGGLLHFLVVWRQWGAFVEVMDPGSGRHWMRGACLLADMPAFPLQVSAERWRRWATRPAALGPWQVRLRRLGIRGVQAQQLFDRAEQDPTWQGFGRLDSGLRFAELLVRSQAFRKGAEAFRLLQSSCEQTAPVQVPPGSCWVRESPLSPEHLIAHGCVVLSFSSNARAAHGSTALPQLATGPSTAGACAAEHATHRIAADEGAIVPVAMRRALADPKWQPLRVLWAMMYEDAATVFWWLGASLLAVAALVPLETLLLRTLLDMDRHLVLGYQQLAWVLALALAVAVGLWLSLWIGKRVAHLGRLLETRVRAALLERLPLLGDEYLRSRASSDMANRGHSVHLLRLLPQLWTQLLRAGLTVMALVLTLLWLYPERGLLIVVLGFVSVLVPLVGGRSLTERSLRAQTQLAALDRFYLDALLGAVPVRVHGAERSIQSAHEELLTEWAKTALSLHRDLTLVRGLQLLITVGGAVALVSDFILSVGEMRSLLLLVFLALQLPGAAGELTSATFALRDVRTLALRALAPLAAPVLVPTTHAAESPGSVRAATPGVAIRLAHVHVVAGGHTLLDDISLDIPAGQHWGIVGASGAGKSSLLGLLLGWLQPRDGTVTIDDQTLDGARQVRLRSETAWVDPAVQLWDQNLLDNLTYADDERVEERLPEALSTADLLDVLSRLPEGLQSELGEGGVRLSGGQGQRVRLGRALLRKAPRLVLLDEPFRGLERGRRQELLRRSRAHWQGSTLLLVSHDVADTIELDRVVVVEGGRIVEVGCPKALALDPGSRYGQKLAEARELRAACWQAAAWRRLSVSQGKLTPTGDPTDGEAARALG